MSENIWFTSDTHISHKNIIHLGHGRPFATIEEHDEAIMQRWNAMITPNDRVYHLGDFSFANATRTRYFICRLNGHKHFIRGNHDSPVDSSRDLFESFQDYKEIKVGDQRLVLLHFPIASWHKIGKGSWHLHGHCVDLDTEILTSEGWKHRQDVGPFEVVATLNQLTGYTEYQQITDVIDMEWTGPVHEIASKSFDGRFTPQHTMLVLSRSLEVGHIQAADFGRRNNRRIPQAALSDQSDYPISDELLRLYIWAVTDGSRENSSLLRFHLKKERKLKRLRELLGDMGIEYSDNPQSSGTTKINLTLPDELRGFSIKPLDSFVRLLSQRQADIILEEYCHTDGCWDSRGSSFQISTSKKSEADLLQEVFVTHGYRCNQISRDDGIHDTRLILSGNRRRFAQTSRASTLTTWDIADSEHFWCVRVPNGSFFMRRNGKVHITGNCHGNLPDTDMARMDVGVDTHDFYPWHYDEIAEKMKNRTGLPGDHHG